MLSLERHTGTYRSRAFALVVDGQVVGEIVLLRVQSCDGRGNGVVSVGFNLAPEIEVVRADAVNRPSGPSYEWLREREEAFRAPGSVGSGYGVVNRLDVNEFPVVGVIGQAEDVPLPDLPDADDAVDDDADQGDPGWGDPEPEPARVLTGQRPVPRRPPSVAPMPLAPADLYVLRRENGR